MREKTCCFTGHRELPTGWARRRLSAKLEKAIVEQINNGYLFFGAGGALGFDYEKEKIMRSDWLKGGKKGN